MSILQKIPMTMYGSEKLKQELMQLKSIDRPKVIQAIAEARANGDLKENADYQAAREQQAFIEGRILDLENKLSLCQIIDVSKMVNDGKVVFGATVSLLGDSISSESNIDPEVTYQIVGDEESDLKANKISISSPLARALIGKYEGDEVTVNTPSGLINYEIVKVEYI